MTTALEQAFPGTHVANATVISKLAEQGIVAYPDLTNITGEDFSIQPWAGVIGPDGAIFMYDATDTTSAHDGTTVLVVSGRRYIRQSSVVPDQFVISLGDNAPPGSPSFGDQYVVGIAPTGDWAANAKDIAIYTARGWMFSSPQRGTLVWVNDENTYYHYDTSDTWSQGLPASGLTNGSISPLKFRHPLALLTVEDVRNDPPLSIPSEGTAYVLDTSPTGAFAEQAGKVAYVENGAYSFIPSFEGATVYDKDQGFDLCYRSGAWLRKVPGSAFPDVSIKTSTSTGSVTFGVTPSFIISDIATAKESTNSWLVEFSIESPTFASSGGYPVVHFFVDAESTARRIQAIQAGGAISNAYFIFRHQISVPDLSSHTFTIKLGAGNASTYNLATGTVYTLQITEVKGS